MTCIQSQKKGKQQENELMKVYMLSYSSLTS
jgi:hypothetical protein